MPSASNFKIGIDATRGVIERAGIGRYSREVIRALLAGDQVNNYTLLFTFMRDASGEKRAEIRSMATLSKRVRTKVAHLPGKWKEYLWGGRAWLFSILDRLVGPQDVFWATSFLEVDLASRLPVVLTIYDLTMFLFPQQRGEALSRYLAQRTKAAVERADKILAISESTKRDLVKILKLKEDKIVVTPLAAADVFHTVPSRENLKQLKSEYALKKDFILSVGTLEPRKNIARLLEAYAMLSGELRERYELLIVGGSGWNNASINQTVRRFKLEGQVRFLGFVPDAALNGLYRLATIFVYPSLYEGFGLPVLEAITAGAPTITSSVSSLPEVGGDGALYVDPNNTGDIKEKMTQLLLSASLRVQLKKRGLLEAKRFSWQRTAQSTLGVLKEVARGKKNAA